MNRGTTWKKLVRKDLRVFDEDATNVILAAMAVPGTVGRVGSNGHVFIKAPNGGGTMSVSRDTSAPNTLKNVQADFRRLFPQEDLTTKDQKEMTTSPVFTDIELATNPLPSNGNGVAAVTPTEAMIPCPAKGCDKEFVTEGAKLAHVRDDHFTCEAPGCTFGTDGKAYVGLTKSAIGGHTNVRHSGHSKPLWEYRDPAKRSEAAKKGAATRAARAAKKAVAPGKSAASKQEQVVHVYPTQVAGVVSTTQPEHRDLPTGGELIRKPTTDAGRLRAIRALLGDDPRVAFLEAANAKLQAKVDDLQAQLDLIAEALHVNAPKKK